MPNLTCR
ncbi:Putative uncharacterized protein [Lacticaseibacillus paracasei]|nr:Putative uncharacterized protein [Lacticaseibacillus paracasei]